jgi:hypothetical protein
MVEDAGDGEGDAATRAAQQAGGSEGALPRERPPRRVENLPFLDLSAVRDRREVAGLHVQNVAIVLVPEDLPDLMVGVTCENVAAVVPVPLGTRVETRIGQVELPGPALATARAGTILALIGQVVVTAPVTAIGYRGLVLVGQLVLPRSAQMLLAPKVLVEVGQVVYYDEGAPVRIILEDAEFHGAFFDLLAEPVTLVLLADCRFAADVAPEQIRAKVHSLAVVGNVRVATAAQQAMLLFLAGSLAGSIRVEGEGEGPTSDADDGAAGPQDARQGDHGDDGPAPGAPGGGSPA